MPPWWIIWIDNPYLDFSSKEKTPKYPFSDKKNLNLKQEGNSRVPGFSFSSPVKTMTQLSLRRMLLLITYKQLKDSVFVISGIIKVEVSVISRSRRLRLRLITLTSTLIIPDITKTESNKGNHALRAQPTDYSLIFRYRLVNNL